MTTNVLGDDLVHTQISADLIPPSQIIKHDKYVISERVIQRTPRDGGPWAFDGTNTIHIDLDSPNEVVDLSKSYLMFDVVLSTGTTAIIDGDAHSFFRQVSIGNGYGIDFQTIPMYAEKHLAEKHNSVGADFCARSFSDFSDNITTADASRNQLTTTATKMSLVLDMPFVQQVKYVPLKAAGGLHFQLQLQDDEDVLAGANTSGAKYQIQNVRYRFHMIRVQQEYLAKVDEAVRNGQFVWTFADVIGQHGEACAATTNSIPIGANVSSAIGLLAQFYLSGDAGTYNKKYLSKSQYIPTLTDCHVQAGSDTYPHQPIDGWVSAYDQLQELFNMRLDGTSESLQTRQKYLASDTNTDFAAVPSFHIGVPFTQFGLSDGINTVNLRPVFNLSCDSAVSNLRVNLWVFYARHILLKPSLIHTIMV